MTKTIWAIDIIGQARKFEKNLSGSAKDSFAVLLKELKYEGPYRANWPNYTKLADDDYHCYLKKSRRPTYVVCWKMYKTKKLIEVYYAGTHENAPY